MLEVSFFISRHRLVALFMTAFSWIGEETESRYQNALISPASALPAVLSHMLEESLNLLPLIQRGNEAKGRVRPPRAFSTSTMAD